MKELYVFLISVLVGGEWTASHPCHYSPGDRDPDNHCIGGWVGPRDSLEDWRNENSLPYLDSNSDPSVVQPVANEYTGYRKDKWKVTYVARAEFKPTYQELELSIIAYDEPRGPSVYM
jgi:hypothetical protein